MERQNYDHLIRRSDPDNVVCVTKDGRRLTRLQELRENPKMRPRADIALLNRATDCPHCSQCRDHYTQYTVFATKDGDICGDGVPLLSAEQRAFCLDEAARLVAVAAIHPEFKVYLHGW